jgi:hypothetical protein
MDLNDALEKFDILLYGDKRAKSPVTYSLLLVMRNRD